MAYTDEQKATYVEKAVEVGLSPAIRELGYPRSKSTATYWIKQAGVEIRAHELAERANELKKFYGYAEQMLVLQGLLDAILETLDDSELSSDEIKKLSDAQAKVITSMELVSGRATDRKATIDPANDELIGLVNRAKDKSEEARQKILEGHGR